MDFQAWARTVADLIVSDRLWTLGAYLLALSACDVAREDVAHLSRYWPKRSLADQLYRALGSIGANFAEGYSHGTGGDRALCYQYALGSPREARRWYFKEHHVLGEEVVMQRVALLAGIIRLLLAMVSDQREHRQPYPTVPCCHSRVSCHLRNACHV